MTYVLLGFIFLPALIELLAVFWVGRRLKLRSIEFPYLKAFLLVHSIVSLPLVALQFLEPSSDYLVIPFGLGPALISLPAGLLLYLIGPWAVGMGGAV
jgi:hypothetical protein